MNATRLLPLIAAVALFAPARAAETPQVPVALHVTGVRSLVSESDRKQIEDQLAVTMTDASCSVRVADAGAPAPLELTVAMTLWRDSEEPGGEPQLDMTTGQEMPGYIHQVEVRYTVQVTKPGDPKPLVEKERRFATRLGTQRVLAFDPRFESRRRALERIAEDVKNVLCKDVKRWRKAQS